MTISKINKALGLAVLTAGVIAFAPARADTVAGLYLDLDGWDVDSSGDMGNARDDMQNFNLGNDTKVSFSLALEHPIPILPNVRVRTVDLNSSGDNTLTSDFTFGGVTFSNGTVVATNFDLKSTDITLYYEVFDNDVISFDLGLTGKYLDGEFRTRSDVGGTTQLGTQSFSGILPMIYGSLLVGVPETGFSFFGELNALQIDNNNLQDYQAGVAYSLLDNMAIDMSIRAGYREFKLELDDVDNVFADWTFNGPFLGVQAHF